MNPSTTLTWGFQVSNRGARDTFNISASTGTWDYYVDTDCDGARDAGENTTLTNTDSALGDTRVGHRPARAEQLPALLRRRSARHPCTELGTSSVTFNLQSSAQPTRDRAPMSLSGLHRHGDHWVDRWQRLTIAERHVDGAPSTVCEPTPAGAGTPFGFRNGTAGDVGRHAPASWSTP